MSRHNSKEVAAAHGGVSERATPGRDNPTLVHPASPVGLTALEWLEIKIHLADKANDQYCAIASELNNKRAGYPAGAVKLARLCISLAISFGVLGARLAKFDVYVPDSGDLGELEPDVAEAARREFSAICKMEDELQAAGETLLADATALLGGDGMEAML